MRHTIKSGGRITHINRTRGLLSLTIMLFMLLVLDFDSAESSSQNDHHHKHPIPYPIIHQIFLHAGISDHKLGVAFALLYSLLKSQIRPGVYESSDFQLWTGTVVSHLIYISSCVYYQISKSTMSLLVISVLTFWLSTGFSNSLINQRTKPSRSLVLAFAVYPIILSLIATYTIVDSERHPISSGALVAIAMFIIGINQFALPTNKNRGNFVGYSDTGTPLFNLESGYVFYGQPTKFLASLTNGMEQILTHSDSRRIFYFLCLNLAFTFVEMVYGVWTNSLGLLSDGFHMLFDCSALVMGLYASIMSKWKPNESFTYGYGRVEVLSGFVNGLFLSIIGISVLIESIMRLFQRPEVKTERLLLVSVAGLLVNLVGIMSFSHAHSHHGHSHAGSSVEAHGHSHHNYSPKEASHEIQIEYHGHSSHSHEHSGHPHDNSCQSHGHSHSSSSHGHSHSLASMENANMKGVFLHVLADTLGSVGVIISSIIIDKFGFYIADPICSLFISITILASVAPLLLQSGRTLMLRVPSELEEKVKHMVMEMTKINGVAQIGHSSIWSQSSSEMVALVNVTKDNSSFDIHDNCESTIKMILGESVRKIDVQLQITDRF